MTKKFVWIGFFVGSTLGNMLPLLWGGDAIQFLDLFLQSSAESPESGQAIGGSSLSRTSTPRHLDTVCLTTISTSASNSASDKSVFIIFSLTWCQIQVYDV